MGGVVDSHLKGQEVQVQDSSLSNDERRVHRKK